jgi:ABC-type Fe3+-hydroxamate transport system substrate-binding protein
MPARRIVSLVPSQTELLFDLGLDSEVVGITKFCVHPEHWKQTKTIVSGTKNVNITAVDSLKPDLIIANKEENTKEDIEKLSKYQVYVSDIKTIDDAYEMMNVVAGLTGTSALPIINQVKASFSSFPSFEMKKALYLIWKKPWMAAGSDTFINEMMKVTGFGNVINEKRYPEISEQAMQQLNPEVVLLSSEPYPFKDLHVEEMRRLLPNAKVILVDGEMFSWYGSRMTRMAEYFLTLRSTAFL